jgi:antitoxin (DNA-binding transcriptional repressor) of toxin-antitoxin stability system
MKRMSADTERKADWDEADTPEGVGIIRARETLGELVNRAGFGNERIQILRNGKPVAFLVGPRDIERLRALDAA